MTNQITAQIAETSTLEAEGKALAKEWTNICRADKRRFDKSTKADGFDTRLGKLMFALKQESEGRIPSARLKECGINSIDKRRRSEALWFVENEDAARDFIKASKKGFTSLTALQAAMRKASKEADAPQQPKAEPSNVGQSEAAPAKAEKPVVVTKQIVFDKLVKVCDANGIDMLELAEMIIDHSTAPTVTEVAA